MLSARLVPSPLPRGRNATSNTRRVHSCKYEPANITCGWFSEPSQGLLLSPSLSHHIICVFAVDLSIGGVWSKRLEEQCEKMEEHHTPLSKQQLVQLIRSLILVEQVHTLVISHDCYLR